MTPVDILFSYVPLCAIIVKGLLWLIKPSSRIADGTEPSNDFGKGSMHMLLNSYLIFPRVRSQLFNSSPGLLLF